MNQVSLIGRLTKDPEVRYSQDDKVFARFTVAVDRDKDHTDYPTIVCAGKTAQLVDSYLGKGRLVGISGRIQTGSYEKDGRKVYTTDVFADRVEFLDKKEAKSESEQVKATIPEGFAQLDEGDFPF